MEMEERRVTRVRIIRKSEPWTWYNVGEEYPAVYDPVFGKYMAVGNGGASRLIEVKDCEEI